MPAITREHKVFFSHLLVRVVGFEPTRPCGHWHLKPARLPVPTHPRIRDSEVRGKNPEPQRIFTLEAWLLKAPCRDATRIRLVCRFRVSKAYSHTRVLEFQKFRGKKQEARCS